MENGIRIAMFLIVIAIVVLSESCGTFVKQGVAIRALETQGYSDIKITDHAYILMSFRGCDKSDSARFTAIAKNPAGKSVEVYVCTGFLFKGATIRTK